MVATWGHSKPGPITATPDGEYLLVGEAGVLAMIDTQLSTPQTGYENPLLHPISSLAVRAVDLLLDPDADLTTSFSAEDLVYVAAGRHGLWAMQAHPSLSEPRAVRLDDAANVNDLAGQSSERYCNDLALIEIDSQPFLLALFAQAGSNRVRAYGLANVRQVVAAAAGVPAELGNEILPDVEIFLDAHPSFQTSSQRKSYGVGLAVDDLYAYVALGQHGLARIDFSVPPGTSLPSANVDFGPYFGDGSPYDEDCDGLYGEFEFADDTTQAPWFVDVAVQRDGDDRYLWAAVDHLGIVRFDVSDPEEWAADLPVDHQEGEVLELADGQKMILLVDDCVPEGYCVPANRRRTYANELRICETSAGPVLSVSVQTIFFVKANGIKGLGRSLDHAGTELPEAPDEVDLEGGEFYTILYDLAEMPGTGEDCEPTVNWSVFLREGGRGLWLQENQPPGAVIVFGGFVSNKSKLGGDENTPNDNITFRARYEDWPDPGAPEMHRRLPEDRPGRNAHDMGHSPTRPEVLLFGSNDGDLPEDGILVHCANGIWRDYDPGSGGEDQRSGHGTLWNPFAVWPESGSNYVFGAGKADPTSDDSHWMMVDFDPGLDVCDDPPTRAPDVNKRVFFEVPLDRFESLGRKGFFAGGAMDLAYDQQNEPSPALPLMFASRVESPDGVLVLRRNVLEDALEGDDPDGEVYHPDDLGARVGVLDTHPEYANIDADHADSDNFIGEQGLRGNVNTFFPHLFELPDPDGPPDPDHWMLAAPCASVHLPDDLPIFETRHQWKPDDVFVEYIDHSMVRVFDVQSRTAIEAGSTIHYTLIGPTEHSTALRLETLKLGEGEAERTYLFVADFGGGIQVWDLTELRGVTDGDEISPDDSYYDDFMIEEWRAPQTATWNQLQNNLWSIAIDYVEWDDGEEWREEVYVYALVSRVGIEVLCFLPENQPGQRLQWVRRIEVPYAFGGLKIRVDGQGERTLLLAENEAGFRIFGYEEEQ